MNRRRKLTNPIVPAALILTVPLAAWGHSTPGNAARQRAEIMDRGRVRPAQLPPARSLGSGTWQAITRGISELKQETGERAEQPGKPSPATDKRAPRPALKGYCPAAYLLLGKAVKGDPAYRSTYRGELYFLSSAEAKERFDANPEKFLPRFGSLCATALGGSYLKRMPAKPEIFSVYDGRVYLFSSQRAKENFDKTPDWFIARAKPVFAEPVLGGYCVVSYQERNKAIKGRADIRYLYRGRYYHFADQDARSRFIAAPERYIPQYDGFCAEGVSRGKRYPADPKVFIIRNGKTYLFFDSAARLKFMADPEPMVEKADADWEG